jgi:O-antigen ligase
MTTFASLLDHRRSPWTATQALLVLLLACAMLLGGTPNEPNWRIAVILLVACALAAWSLVHGAASAFQRLPLLMRVAVLAFPSLWLLQLVPLPPAIWEGLPGRALARRVFDLVGAQGEWHPLSLTPSTTLFGANMLLPALAAFLAALTLDARGRERCVASFLMLAALSILVGLAQLSSRGTVFNFHDSGHKANLLGFFANRNHQALMLGLSGIFAIATLRRDLRATPVALSISLAVMAVLLVCIIGTISRSGLALAMLGMLAMLALAFGERLDKRRWAMLAGGAMLAGLVLSFSPVVQNSLARFDAVGEDARWQAWSRSASLALQYFPWGGGLGGFTSLYNPIEPLEAVRPAYLNHAHNDYLELLIEAGLPGMIGLLAFAAACLVRVVGLFRAKTWGRCAFAVPAAISLLLVAIHSLVDYPLRTQAIAVLLGILAAFFLAAPRASEERA